MPLTRFQIRLVQPARAIRQLTFSIFLLNTIKFKFYRILLFVLFNSFSIEFVHRSKKKIRFSTTSYEFLWTIPHVRFTDYPHGYVACVCSWNVYILSIPSVINKRKFWMHHHCYKWDEYIFEWCTIYIVHALSISHWFTQVARKHQKTTEDRSLSTFQYFNRLYVWT